MTSSVSTSLKILQQIFREDKQIDELLNDFQLHLQDVDVVDFTERLSLSIYLG